jgi:hypothetical protein
MQSLQKQISMKLKSLSTIKNLINNIKIDFLIFTEKYGLMTGAINEILDANHS